MGKHLVRLAYDCALGKAPHEWEIWDHEPEIGEIPEGKGRCYGWVSGTSDCQDSESSYYREVSSIADFSLEGIGSIKTFWEKIEGLVKYNEHKGFVLDMGEVKSRRAGPFEVQFNPDRERRVGRLPGQKDDPDHPKCALSAAIHSNVPEFLKWKDYCLFPNPYPIFRDSHFTLVYKEHEDKGQALTLEKIRDGIDFFSEARYFKMFFNGINAGATSPDHFHFQGFSHQIPLPVELFPTKEITSDKTIKISEPRDYPATAFIVESENAEELAKGIRRMTESLDKQDSGMEMTYNLLFSNCWVGLPKAYIFPRDARKQKSEHYNGKPAAIEMSGMLIMSKQEDIKKYRNADNDELSDLVTEVLKDVTVPKGKLSPIAV